VFTSIPCNDGVGCVGKVGSTLQVGVSSGYPPSHGEYYIVSASSQGSPPTVLHAHTDIPHAWTLHGVSIMPRRAETN
jgi:hypothetical protein